MGARQLPVGIDRVTQVIVMHGDDDDDGDDGDDGDDDDDGDDRMMTG